jgi:hypothetical protein
MGQAQLDAVEAWTGTRPTTCPWRPFAQPADQYVMRVMRAHRWFDKGQLALYESNPSHRLLEGVAHFDSALQSVERHQIEEERANEAARRAAGARA